MALELGTAVVGVEAGSTPIVVGVVGVGGELEKDPGGFPRRMGSDHKKHSTGGGSFVSLNEGAAPILDLKRDLVVTRAPVVGDLELMAGRPLTPMTRGVLGDGMRGPWKPGSMHDPLRHGSDPFDEKIIGRGGGRCVEGDGVSGTVAKPVRVTLDEEWRGGGQWTQEGSEKRQEQGNSVSH